MLLPPYLLLISQKQKLSCTIISALVKERAAVVSGCCLYCVGCRVLQVKTIGLNGMDRS